jgi:SagB-type dehydrogenase family enzyme
VLEVQERTVQLPAPRRKSRMSLEEAIASRRSRRTYRSDPLSLSEAGQLLWAAQGITGPEGQRTAPSAGALYPMEVRLAAMRVDGLAPGVYRYRPEEHDLVLEEPGDYRKELTTAACDQDCVRFSACVLIFAANPEQTIAKYGSRAGLFVQMEAAHAAQNVYLQATALGLGTVVIGAFEPAAIRRVAGLPRGENPVYLMALGKV